MVRSVDVLLKFGTDLGLFWMGCDMSLRGKLRGSARSSGREVARGMGAWRSGEGFCSGGIRRLDTFAAAFVEFCSWRGRVDDPGLRGVATHTVVRAGWTQFRLRTMCGEEPGA